MDKIWLTPGSGRQRQRVSAFLAGLGLDFDENVQATLLLQEDGVLLATGSRDHNVLKCIGVSPDRQGEGLAAILVTELTREALQAGYRHLFLYTSPESAPLFRELGYYDVARAEQAVLLENQRGGVERFVASIRQPRAAGSVGCIVANGNPFTLGHRYLVEQAVAQCDFLYLFILSEQRSLFPAEVRLRLAREATADLGGVAVVPTGDYLVSSATFPDYFLKDKATAANVSCDLDLAVFAQHFAGPLGIGKRFVGTEPYCLTTSAYNARMRAVLPGLGVEVVELPRLEVDGRPVSASRVRALLAEGRLPEARALVPDPTWRYLQQISEA